MSKTTYNIPEESSNQTISINGRTLSISDGNSIELPDRDDQTLNISDHQLTISNGNTVQLPNDKQTISKSGNKVVLSNNGGEVELPESYDDSDVKRRLGVLEAKPDKDNQTLSLDESTRVLSISNGNSVTIPNDKQTISKSGNKLILSNGGGEVDLPQPNSSVSYDDTDLRNRVVALESKPDKDTVYNDTDVKNRLTALETKEDKPLQHLSIVDRTISISGGNSINLPVDNDTIYNDTDIKHRLDILENKTDNFVTGVTASREGNKVRLTYNFVSGQPKNVEFDDKDTIGVAYDDTAIRNRLQNLESKPSPTLSLSGNTLSLTNGGSVELPSQNSSVYRATKGKINNNATYKSNIVNGDDIKAGDIVHDVDSTGTTPKDIYYKVTSVSGNTVNVEKLGERNIPVGTSYDDSSLRNRVQALESKADRDNQTLTFNEGTRSLSLSGGNSITIPNDKQTLSKSGNKLVLSNGGGEVDIPYPTPYDDTNIKSRLSNLENKQNSTSFRISKNVIDGEIGSSKTIRRDTLLNSDNIKSGDIIEDQVNNNNIVTNGYWKVTEVSDYNVTITKIGIRELQLDKQQISLNGKSITLSGGGTVELPDTSSVFRLSKGDIQGGSVGFTTTIRKDTLMNPDGVKEGDIIQDYWSGTTSANQEYWKVTSVSGDNVSIQNIGRRDLPVSIQRLSINGNRLTLSDNGGSVDLPDTSHSYVVTKGKINNNITYKSNLIYSGDVKVGDIVRDIDTTGNTPKEVYYTISSVSGNTVNMSKITDKDIPVIYQNLTLNGNTLSISNGNSVTIPQPDLREYVSISAYNEVKNALTRLLQDLKNSGAWEQTGDNILAGRLKNGRSIATGNINLFSNGTDTASFIRTNNTSTENDLAGGVG